MKTYQWLNLQKGQLPLQPDGSVVPSLSHICSITLIWPDDEKPNPANSIIVDPCFSRKGYRAAKSKLEKINVAFSDIGFYFVTHAHRDHLLHFPVNETNFSGEVYVYEANGILGSIRIDDCPGHYAELSSLNFLSKYGTVWIVSDAILNRIWLKAWQYYWPNGYRHAEIVQTWRSVALILSKADWIVPGHGRAFQVTRALLTNLITSFPYAAYAEDCLDVVEILGQRLSMMKSKSNTEKTA